MTSTARAVLAVVVLAGLFAGARRGLAPVADRIVPLRDPSFLPDGKALRAVSLGQRHLLADYYWLSLVQYVGASADAPKHLQRWDAVYPVADLVTDLDPRYGWAYQEAGGILSGLAGRVDLSNRILRKGLAAVPDRWQISWNLGFNAYFYGDDLRAAAEHFKRAADVGKRPHLYIQSAQLAMDASGEEDLEFAVQVLEVALKESVPGPLRDALLERYLKARTYRVLRSVELAAAAFTARAGRPPASVQDLVAGGVLSGVPADPAGGRIVWDPATGKARSTVLGERQRFLNLNGR